eukprot:354069-Chlamydomonas_euryale.AAC.24
MQAVREWQASSRTLINSLINTGHTVHPQPAPPHLRNPSTPAPPAGLAIQPPSPPALDARRKCHPACQPPDRGRPGRVCVHARGVAPHHGDRRRLRRGRPRCDRRAVQALLHGAQPLLRALQEAPRRHPGAQGVQDGDQPQDARRNVAPTERGWRAAVDRAVWRARPPQGEWKVVARHV